MIVRPELAQLAQTLVIFARNISAQDQDILDNSVEVYVDHRKYLLDLDDKNILDI